MLASSEYCSGWYFSCRNPALFDGSYLENDLTNSHDIPFLVRFRQTPIMGVYWHSELSFNYSNPWAFMDLQFTIMVLTSKVADVKIYINLYQTD